MDIMDKGQSIVFIMILPILCFDCIWLLEYGYSIRSLDEKKTIPTGQSDALLYFYELKIFCLEYAIIRSIRLCL